MMRNLMRLTFVGGLGLIVVLLTAPTDACGCGAVIPLEGDAGVEKETALIRWLDGVEDIVMQLDVEGTSKEAAWILPVPAPASVKLGDPKLFDALAELTKPIVQPTYEFLPMISGAGAPPPPGGSAVTLLTRQTLGPFDVSTLAESDANALSDWLKANGYVFPAKLAPVLRPYVEQGWFYVAVKLAPAGRGETLTGALDPLWLTFESDQIIYPMRPVMLAPGDLPMLLYVLAEHRVDHPKDRTRSFDTQMPFADWIDPQSLTENSPLTPFVMRRVFLTKFEDRIYAPQDIDYDFVFTFAPNDETYRTVVYESRGMAAFAGVPVFIWVCCILPVGLLLAMISLRKRKKRAPARA